MTRNDGNVYFLPQNPEQLIRWHTERAERSMDIEEVETSDAWYEHATPTEIMNRARAAQMAVNKIVEEMKQKEHDRCFVTPGVHHKDCPLAEEKQKHTPTNCWCGQSWDLR